jgi:hypothetical protein
MAVIELFSKRLKRARGDVPDVYSYEKLPERLKVQIVHIVKDGFDHRFNTDFTFNLYRDACLMLRREVGVFELIKYPKSHQEELFNYFLQLSKVEDELDVVEFCFKLINVYVRNHSNGKVVDPDAAIAELNERFREAAIGYQFIEGQIIRIDSEVIHAEVVKPALTLLHSKLYENAEQEFLSAHKHYREGHYQECITSCAKTFESVMKIICEKRKWSYNQHDTAAKLIEKILANGLIPSHLQTHFTGLRSMLESGIPTVRNKQAAHGQGVVKIEVPSYLASYILHQTAATVLMLAQAEEAMS